MATKRKTKTEVTYDVEFRSMYNPHTWVLWARDIETLKDAKAEAPRCGPSHTRIVRVERTVVAEVKP